MTESTAQGRELTLDDFDYHLPPELIAQHPASQRTASRLLHLDTNGGLHDRQFPDLLDQLSPGDVMVFNNTRVIKARLHGEKDTGGRVEILVERLLANNRVLAHVRASKSPKPGSALMLGPDRIPVRMLARHDDLFELEFPDEVLPLLDSQGEVPLPPYIEHGADASDEQRYQTVYASQPGAVAAPTAGLHFDEAMLAAIDARGVIRAEVTLHVGAGTFLPVRVEKIAEHVMHAEWYRVDATVADAVNACKARGGRVIAVGTTSVRSLESAARHGMPLTPQAEDTRLFITPGFDWRVVDALVTNFHLPKSTLMMLISSFAGRDPVMRAYAHAVAQRYRFFSYGDAMFIERPKAGS